MTPHPNTKTAAATVSVAAAALLLLAPARAAQGPDTTAPTGIVAGVSSPASGTLELRLYANDSGWGLASAEARLDGAPPTTARLGAAGCPESPAPGEPEPPPGDCPSAVSAFPLALDTRAVPDGTRPLVVRVTDAAGNTATLTEREISVRNAPRPPSGPIATLDVGISGTDTRGGGGGKGRGGGGKGGPAGPPCRKPQVKMHLVSRPLWRTRPGKLPVLRFRKRHLYKGHLTCKVGGKRVLAPSGARVDVFYRIWRRSFRKRRGPIRVRKGAIRTRKGRLRVKLGFLSGRTIVFRYLSPQGERTRDKLRIAIARTDPPRRGQ